jgi:DNA-binding response OmpR family regulator
MGSLTLLPTMSAAAGNGLEEMSALLGHALIAEDEWLIAADLEHHLRGRGCEVVEHVNSVADGLAALRARRPDLVLLDVQLADGRATSLAEALVAAAVPFFLLTGYRCGDFEEPMLRDAPCLAKPCDEAEFQAAIDRLLGR